jgi:hypothetical protein
VGAHANKEKPSKISNNMPAMRGRNGCVWLVEGSKVSKLIFELRSQQYWLAIECGLVARPKLKKMASDWQSALNH